MIQEDIHRLDIIYFLKEYDLHVIYHALRLVLLHGLSIVFSCLVLMVFNKHG